MIETKSHSKGKNRSGLETAVTMQGIGLYVPDNIITNEELCEKLNISKKWIERKIGIKERRFLNDELVTSDMCIEASKEALEKSNVLASEIDAIILTTSTPDYQLPSTALIVKEALGAIKAIPIDLTQTACAGGIYSVVMGSHLMQNEFVNNILVIGAEVQSRYTNPNDKTTRIFFGDAAGAMVLQKTNEGYGILSWDIDSSLDYAVNILGAGSAPLPEGETLESSQYVNMDGRQVWKVATEKIPMSLRKVIKNAELSVADIDHFIIHQANINIVKTALEELDVSLDKTTFTIQDYGNTGSASIFTALYRALHENKISDGDYIAFSAIGAGFIWGSMCVRFRKINGRR